MATIKIRRGTTDPITLAPGGVTSGEPIFNTVLNKLFVHNGTTGIWVGAEVDNGTGLGSSETKIPTQYAVKTYVDNNLASGAVTSINGVTGAASLRAGTGISVTPGTDPDKGITITNIGVQSAVGGTGISVSGATGSVTFTNTGVQSLNGSTGAVTNVARINEGNTFSVKQVMSAGITTSQLNVVDIASFNDTLGQILFRGTTATFQSTATVVSSASGRLIVGHIQSPDIEPIGALRLLGFGQSGGHDYQYTNDITPVAHNTQTANLTHTLPSTTGTLLNSNSAVTSAVGGTGISVSGATGAVTFTNTGVQSLNGSTGAVTNVARINEGNTFSVQQVMNAGITVGGTSTSLFSTSTTVQNATGLLTLQPNTIGNNSILRVMGYNGVITPLYNDIKPQSIQASNLVHTLPSTTGTLLNSNSAVTSAVGGTGISVSGATGAVTFTNTGVQSAVAGNQITVSGATGAVTIGVTATPSFTTITTTGNGTVGGNLVVTGNLTINGTSTTVNSNTMTVDDPLIIIGTSGGLPISADDGGKDRGIVFNYYDTAGRTGFFGWDANLAEFAFQQSSTVTNEIVAGVTYGNVHVANLRLQNGAVTDTIVGSTSGSQTHQFRNYGGLIVNSNAEPTTGYILKGNSTGSHTWQDPTASGFTAFAATSLATARNIALSGDVTGTVSFDGTANVSITTTIAANSVELGTDTTGNYVSSIGVSGIGLSTLVGGGEGATYTIVSGATSANSPSQIVARDASGNFTAGTITATSFVGNASTATSAATLTTARLIALSGDLTGTASFDGSAGITITAAIAANSVELGTDTTGNYVSNIIVSGTGLSVSGVSGEGTAFTITSGATSANTASQIVARDASGNFTAGTITASSFVGTVTGNVSGSAATLTTARSIALGGDLSGSANFDGSAGITITAAIVSGSIVDADINASAAIADTKLATISADNKVSLSALNIDGGTAAGNIAGIDLLIVDNGANGTNRKVTVNNLFGSSSTAVIDGGSY